ncbi:MAG: DUF4350 domain-containing protein [Verrucomicrobia bacterium]|nr:DUF4350 domain-containing protein [Verrucomicrobiota bacterium]
MKERMNEAETSIIIMGGFLQPNAHKGWNGKMKIMLWYLLITVPLSLALAAEPDVAELSFDRRFEQAETFASVKKPAWVTHIEQQGGAFIDQPASWQVPASAPDGSGRLTISVDRSLMTGDLAATILFSADKTSDLALQLFDSNGRVILVDALGNLVEISEALSTDTFIIPLSKYPTAKRIVIRQIHGPIAVYGAILYAVATEGAMLDDEVQKLAIRLGDPLSPENPIIKNLHSLAEAKALNIKPTTSIKKSLPSVLHNTIIERASPSISGIRAFTRPTSILVEDSHGGSDIYNEYNFGSAQLARVLSAQGAKVESTRDLKGFDPNKGITPKLLSLFNIVIFNGRFSGRDYPFSKSEIIAITDWVHAGGSLLVTCSATSAGDHLDSQFFNPLIKPFELQFGPQNIKDVMVRLDAKESQPILKGLLAFHMYHGISVTSSAHHEAMASFSGQPVLVARKFGRGRVIAFGAGSALQNQAMGSKILQHPTKPAIKLNTDLLMSLSLWLAGEKAPSGLSGI